MTPATRADGPSGRASGPGRVLLETWTRAVRGSVDQLIADLRSDGQRVARSGAALGEAVSAAAIPLVQAARATPRAARLVRESLAMLAAYRVHDGRRPFLSPEALRVERDELDRRWAERIQQLCIELRGAVLKLGQFASTRRDLLPPAFIEALARLQDSVPPVPFEGIAGRVRAELGAPIEALFAAFDAEPIAAGSLAQVHGAVLPDGTRVAVKVQVPEVEAQVEADLSLFSLMAGALRELVPSIDLVSIAAELGRSVRQELDFRLEAQHARRAAADADGSAVVPRVHEALSSARVLTMDRIDGERLTDFLGRCHRDPEQHGRRDAVLAALVRTFARQILGAGRFQADPHPGNFLIRGDGALVLLDFGAMRELGDDERRAYAALTGAVIARDGDCAARLMTELGFAVRPGGDPAALLRFADLLLDAFRPSPDRPLAELDPRAAFDQTLALGRDSPILIPHHFVQIGRVLSSLAGLILAYRPRIELWPLVAPYLVDRPGQPGP